MEAMELEGEEHQQQPIKFGPIPLIDQFGTRVHRIPLFFESDRCVIFTPPCMPWDDDLAAMGTRYFSFKNIEYKEDKNLFNWLLAQTAYRKLVEDRDVMYLFQHNASEQERKMRGSPYAHGTRRAYVAFVGEHYKRMGGIVPDVERQIVADLIKTASFDYDLRAIVDKFPELPKFLLNCLEDKAVPGAIGYDATIIVGRWVIE